MAFFYLVKSVSLQIMSMYSTLYTSDNSISNIIDPLTHDLTILSKWLYNNFMILNPEKCLFILIGVDDELKLIWCMEMKLLKTLNKK